MDDKCATSGIVFMNKIDNLASIMESCRICMARSDNKNCIFDAGKENIIDEVQYCTGIQLKNEAGYPSTICTICLQNLSIAHKFKTSCLLATETFQKLLLSTIKTEDQDSDGEFDVCLEYYNAKVKEEIVEKEVVMNGVRKSRRIKKENECVKDAPAASELRRDKSKAPRRLKKYKFKKLWCEPCGTKFDSKIQSDRHNREKHGDRTWVCEVCGKVMTNRASLYSHVRSHLPPQYACDACDYKTWHRHDLVKHLRIHSGTKLYQCEYCTSSFYTSSNLTGHIRRTHMNQRDYACNICTKTFFDKTKLNRHMDSHNEVKRHECEVCKACFTRRCYWKKHLLRQHNITTPPQRPGRQKTNLIIGEHLVHLK